MNVNKDLFLSKLCDSLGKAGLQERADRLMLEEGVSQADKIIDAVRNIQVERIQGIGDDFVPDTWLYNTLGTIYPLLPRELKDNTISAYLKQMDGVNYFYTQLNHTSHIREPLALSDLLIARWLYFPGLEAYEEQIKKHSGFGSFKKEFMQSQGLFAPDQIQSDFLMAYAVLRKDISRYSADYAKAAHPVFLDRVVKGLTGIFAGGSDKPENEKSNIDKLKALLPALLHPKIDEHYAKRDWADQEKFRL